MCRYCTSEGRFLEPKLVAHGLSNIGFIDIAKRMQISCWGLTQQIPAVFLHAARGGLLLCLNNELLCSIPAAVAAKRCAAETHAESNSFLLPYLRSIISKCPKESQEWRGVQICVLGVLNSSSNLTKGSSFTTLLAVVKQVEKKNTTKNTFCSSNAKLLLPSSLVDRFRYILNTIEVQRQAYHWERRETEIKQVNSKNKLGIIQAALPPGIHRHIWISFSIPLTILPAT